MLALTIVLGVLLAFFATVAIFLGIEFLKKFGFMRLFIINSRQMVGWYHRGFPKHQRGMHNIVLRGQKKFSALVGFKLDIPLLDYSGFDYYGIVDSDADGVAVISTYLGKGHCLFQFFVNTDLDNNRITVSCTKTDQFLTPHEEFPPHWYQRIGFYG